MRKTVLFLAVIGLATSLWAADPIIGTWKLNVAKSKFGAGVPAPMKEQTNAVKELNADQVEVAITGTGTNGTTYAYKMAFPIQGGAVVGAATVSGVLTVFGPGDWCFTGLQDGKQIRFSHVVVSKDGKTATETSKSRDAAGNIAEALLVYDKQ